MHQGQTNSQNDIWTIPRLESTQTQTNLPSYENVVCQQNYEFEEFYNPPSYNDAMVSGQWNYDQNSVKGNWWECRIDKQSQLFIYMNSDQKCLGISFNVTGVSGIRIPLRINWKRQSIHIVNILAVFSTRIPTEYLFITKATTYYESPCSEKDCIHSGMSLQKGAIIVLALILIRFRIIPSITPHWQEFHITNKVHFSCFSDLNSKWVCMFISTPKICALGYAYNVYHCAILSPLTITL